MDTEQQRNYLDQVRRNRRRSRMLWGLSAVAIIVAFLAATVWYDQLACHYSISREGYPVPDLTGKTLDEARDTVRTCIDIQPTNAPATPSDAQIAEQDPAPPTVMNDDRTIRVTLRPPG